jgi:hypothetical protein
MRSFSDLDPNDVKLFTHIGHFLHWFTAAELGITNLLARALDYTHFDKFEVLASRMDARFKCTRLRIDASKFMEIGPNLDARLKHFENVFIPMRNNFAHRLPILEAGGSKIRFSGSVDVGTPPKKAADQISVNELFEQAEWLNWFASELSMALNGSALTGKLEIIHPRTRLPQAHSPKKT